MNRNFTIADTEYKILNTFKYYKQGPSVPSDGNCGLHAICKALGDGMHMTVNNTGKTSLMLNIFYMFDLEKLPNYWWSDEELAVIANYFGYDMYIYNETDRTGIVFGKGVRPPLVLYSVNNNSHWIPGMKTVIPSSSIPENFTIIENISEVLSIRQIKMKIKGHLLMRTLNPSGGCIESCNIRCDENRISSIGRRVKSSNRSCSRECVEWRGKSLSGKNNVNRNEKHDESLSGEQNGSRNCEERDEVRTVKQNGSRPQLKEGHGGEVKGSHSERKESFSPKNYEKCLVPCSPLINTDCSRDMDAFKQHLSLYAKPKNTKLSKIVKQLCRWNRNKKNKYKKIDLFESENEDDDLKDTELNAIYKARYAIMRDVLHNYIPKSERKLLMLKNRESSVAPQSLETAMFQPIKYPQLESVKIECPKADVNCCPIETINCCPEEAVDCCSVGAIDCCSKATVDCCSNSIIDCPFLTSNCSLASNNCQFIIADCPFPAPQYPCNDQWVSNYYVGDNYAGDNYVGHNYDGDNYVGDNYAGDNYVGHNYVGHNYDGDNYAGDNYVGDNYAGDNYDGDNYAGDNYAGDNYAGDNYVGHNYGGHNYVGHNYAGDNYVGHNYDGDNYAGDNYAGDNYVGDNYVGHNYAGHNYVGHNYVDDNYVSNNYISNLFDGHTFGRNKNIGVRLFDRIYNQTVAISKNIIVRRIFKPKRAVEAPLVVAASVAASIVVALVVASPIVAAGVVVSPQLESSVMAAPVIVGMTVVTVPSVNDLVTAPMDNDLVTVPIDNELMTAPIKNKLVTAPINNHLVTAPENNLAVSSVGKGLVVKPKESVKRYFSFKQIWQKKTQHAKDH